MRRLTAGALAASAWRALARSGGARGPVLCEVPRGRTAVAVACMSSDSCAMRASVGASVTVTRRQGGLHTARVALATPWPRRAVDGAAAGVVGAAALAGGVMVTIATCAEGEREGSDGSSGRASGHHKYVDLAMSQGVKVRPQYTARRKASTMKERITSQYEDKIREHANPGKIFRYFATVSIDGTVYMRPQDFIRSITPGELQPEGLGLDQFDTFKSTDAMLGRADPQDPLLQYNEDGTLKETLTLISYAEYRFLCTLLTAPENYLRVAFRLMDRSGDDSIDIEEFYAMTDVLGDKTRQRRLTQKGGMWDDKGILEHSHLLRQLFGVDGKGTINFDQFRCFALDLQRRVLHINYLYTKQHRHGHGEKRISEISFCKMLLKHAQLPRNKRKVYYDRINKVYGEADAQELRIGFDEVHSFFQFLEDIELFDMAVGATLKMRDDRRLVREDLEHIAQAVSGQTIGPYLAGVVFVMFDLDKEDNTKGVSELIRVARNARSHGVIVDSGPQRSIGTFGKSLVSLLSGTDTDGDGHMDYGEKTTK